MDHVWVKVIHANPLKGPCEGQVQFITDWHLRKAEPGWLNYVRVSYKGKKYRLPIDKGYVTIHDGFVKGSNFMFTWVRVPDSDGKEFYLGPSPSGKSWEKAVSEDPPTLRNFRIWLGNSNDRYQQGTVEHWDACILARTLIPKYFKRYWARQARLDGDNLNAYASVYPSEDECITLYVEDDGPVSRET